MSAYKVLTFNWINENAGQLVFTCAGNTQPINTLTIDNTFAEMTDGTINAYLNNFIIEGSYSLDMNEGYSLNGMRFNGEVYSDISLFNDVVFDDSNVTSVSGDNANYTIDVLTNDPLPSSTKYLDKIGLTYFWNIIKNTFTSIDTTNHLAQRVSSNEDSIEELQSMIKYRRNYVVPVASIVSDSTYSDFPYSYTLAWDGCTENHINWASLAITCSYKRAYAIETNNNFMKIYFERMPRDIEFSLLAIGKGVEVID